METGRRRVVMLFNPKMTYPEALKVLYSAVDGKTKEEIESIREEFRAIIPRNPLLFRSFLLQLTSEPFLSKQSCFIIDGLLPNKWDTEKLHSRTQYTGTSYISPMTSFTPINSISIYQTASLDSKDIISITENLILHTSYTVG